MKAKSNNIFKDWFDKTNWSKRKTKAICKPCWEIKYCPYGPLIEQFPLQENRDEKSCRIFGHQCPVFYVAEPFSETKVLRNITRQIPRPTQIRVYNRDRQVCRICNNLIKDEEIEYDHIIPWSKGGSSDENNLRLLCKSCNRKKGKKFEDEFLVESAFEHMEEPEDEKIIEFLIFTATICQKYYWEFNELPTVKDFAKMVAIRKITRAEESAISYFIELNDFFYSKKPVELSKDEFNSLKTRWGFNDGIVYKIKEVCKITNLKIDDYFKAEKNLIQRLGFRMKDTAQVEQKWKRT